MVSDVIIVGAGLSGLAAAQQLKQAGKIVAILDKGRSVGGRLATRRIGDGLADHGAQFFTVRSEEFQTQVDQWLGDDLVYVWGHGWSDGSLKKFGGDGHPRYAARNGMNSLAKDLAKSLGKIHVSTRVSNVTWNDNLWHISDTEHNQYQSQVLIMTPPVPQTLDLIQNVHLPQTELEALQRIQYGPCLCGLFVIEGDIDLPEPGAIQNFDNDVYWIADNQQKGISPDEHVITVHAGTMFSRTRYDNTDDDTLAILREELSKYLSEGTKIKAEQLKRWRYSVPITTHPHDVLQSEDFPVIFAGDAFGGRGRVEGAYLSGKKAGETAIQLLDS